MQKTPHGRSQRNQAGFTLVELLVVIAIVGMLVAILLPVLSNARKQAQATICSANERQQGVAMVNYTLDARDYYVNPWYAEKKDTSGSPTADGRKRDTPFAVQLHGYLAAPVGTWTDADGETVTGLPVSHLRNAWTCPQGRPGWDTYSGSRSVVGAGNYTINPFLFAFYPPGATVGDYNQRYGMQWNGTLYDKPLMRANLTPRPSTTIMMSEGYVNYNNGSNGTVTIGYWPPANHATCIPKLSNGRYLWHVDSGNFLFADGHAKAIKQSIFKQDEVTYRPELYRMSHGRSNLTGLLVP